MIVQAALASCLVLGGLGALVPVRRHVPRAAIVWMAFPVGAALYMVIGLTAVLVGGSHDPVLAALVVGLGGGALLVGWPAGVRERISVAAQALGVAVGVVAVTGLAHLTRLTPDSMRYLLFAIDLVRPEALVEVNAADLVIRQFGLPSLHSLASVTDQRYVAWVSPMFGVSGFGLMTWACWHVGRALSWRRRAAVTVVPLLFVLSSNRMLYDAFYINTHIQMAVYLLIAVLGIWFAVGHGLTGWALPAGVALGAMIVLRPEAPLVVALVLVTAAASGAHGRARWALASPVSIAMVLWYGAVLWDNAPGGDDISPMAPVFGSLLAVGMAVATLWLVPRWRAVRVVANVDRMAVAGLGVLVILLGAISPGIVVDSVIATARNLTYNGLWLTTWLAMAPALAWALAIPAVPHRRLFTVPIGGFMVLFWLLPLVRGSAWRVGPGDSGNRLLAHILPVAVVFLVLTFVTTEEPERTPSTPAGRPG